MRRPVVLAALGYLAVALVVLGPSIRAGHTVVPADALTQYAPYRNGGGFRADNPIVSDAATQFLPWFRFVARGLRHGTVPQWNPHILGGVRVTPNGYVSAYYPPTWLGGLVDPFDAYDLFVLLHVVLGALGIYAFSRVLGARPLAAWVAGALAPAAGFWLHWSLHLVNAAGVVWLPWALAAVHLVLARPDRRRVAALAGVLALWLLGASPQYAFFGGLAVAGYAAVQLLCRAMTGERRLAFRAGAGLVVASAVGALVAAPVLLPTMATSGDVLRVHEPTASMTRTHLPLRHGIRLLVGETTGHPGDGVWLYATSAEDEMDSPFVGVIGALLAIAGLVGTDRRTRRDRLLLGAGVGVVLVLAFAGPPHLLLRAVVPGYDRFRGSARWCAVLPAFALPLAALGLDQLLAGDRRTRRALIVGAGVAGATVVAWLVREQAVAQAPHAYLARRASMALALMAAAVGAALLARTRRRLALLVLAGCVLVEVFTVAPRWYPRVRERLAYPPVGALEIARARGGRLIRVGGRRALPTYLPPDIPLAYDTNDVSGVSPLFPRDWDRFLRLVDDYGNTAEELNVAPPLARRAQLRSPLVSLLDARVAIGPGATLELLPCPSPGGATVVADARPSTRAAMWDAVARRGWDPRRRAAVAGLRRPVVGGPGTARQVRAGADRERWLVDAPAGGFLRVSGRYDAGWSARVDGRRTRVLRADAVFRGVVVPPGHHVVTFAFTNPDEHRGRLVALAGLVALVGLTVGRRPSRRPGDSGS